MANSFDVVIAGCGPAGTTAGYVLAKQGLSVVLIDKAVFPRKKLCGGLLSWKSMQTLEKVFGETVESLAEKNIIDYSTPKWSINYKHRRLAEGEASFPFHLINREQFDHHLLNRAVEAGAVHVPDSPVTGCTPETGVVTTATGQSYLGKCVIGADGASSVIRHSFPLDRKLWRRHLASTIEFSIPRSESPRQVEYPELYAGYVKAGYCWAFPNQDKIILGICGLRRGGRSLKHHFTEFLRMWGFSETDNLPFEAHPLPYGNFLREPVFEKVALAGDAGGFVEPLFGEGLFYAMRTGMYAANAAHDAVTEEADLRRAYLAPLKKHIYPELSAADRLRWFLMFSMRWLSPLSLKLFVQSQSSMLAEMVHGMRSYRRLQKKNWD